MVSAAARVLELQSNLQGIYIVGLGGPWYTWGLVGDTLKRATWAYQVNGQGWGDWERGATTVHRGWREERNAFSSWICSDDIYLNTLIERFVYMHFNKLDLTALSWPNQTTYRSRLFFWWESNKFHQSKASCASGFCSHCIVLPGKQEI